MAQISRGRNTAEQREVKRGIQQLNVIWVLFSFMELYFVVKGTATFIAGIVSISLAFFVVWIAGQNEKYKANINAVLGDVTRGQWER